MCVHAIALFAPIARFHDYAHLLPSECTGNKERACLQLGLHHRCQWLRQLLFSIFTHSPSAIFTQNPDPFSLRTDLSGYCQNMDK